MKAPAPDELTFDGGDAKTAAGKRGGAALAPRDPPQGDPRRSASSLWRLGAGLLGDHVVGVPVGPVHVVLAGLTLLVLAVGDGGAAHGVGEVGDRGVAGVVRVDALG